jgi:GST-like protein
MASLTLYGRRGWGSAIIEAQLEWLGLAYKFVEVDDLFHSAKARASLSKINPLAQVPTLVLPDGQIITESAAITLHLADITARTDLVPPSGAPKRPAFLRWLIFLVANIYPTYTYADDPARFVADAAAQGGFLTSVDAYAQRLYLMAEATAGDPWFLGHNFSALDIYIAVLNQWRPGPAWFAANAPRLHGIALKTAAIPALQPVWSRNFPGSD